MKVNNIQDWLDSHTGGERYSCDEASDCLIMLAQVVQKEVTDLASEHKTERSDRKLAQSNSKSEDTPKKDSITTILGDFAVEIINYDKRMDDKGAPLVRFVGKYIKKYEKRLKTLRELAKSEHEELEMYRLKEAVEPPQENCGEPHTDEDYGLMNCNLLKGHEGEHCTILIGSPPQDTYKSGKGTDTDPMVIGKLDVDVEGLEPPKKPYTVREVDTSLDGAKHLHANKSYTGAQECADTECPINKTEGIKRVFEESGTEVTPPTSEDTSLDVIEEAEKLMRIAEQATGPIGYGVTPAFVTELEAWHKAERAKLLAEIERLKNEA